MYTPESIVSIHARNIDSLRVVLDDVPLLSWNAPSVIELTYEHEQSK